MGKREVNVEERYADGYFDMGISVLTTHIQKRDNVERRAAFTLQNGLDAQKLNQQFKGLTSSSPCTSGETACVNGQLAQCVGNKFELSPCSATLQCVALPLVNKPGTRYVVLCGSIVGRRKAER